MSDLVGNPADRFSRGAAYIILLAYATDSCHENDVLLENKIKFD